MHQNQWLAAIAELETRRVGVHPGAATIEGEEHNEYSYQFWNCSDGTESRQGSWASGTSPDGKGEFTFLEDPQPLAGAPTPPSPRPADMCNTGS